MNRTDQTIEWLKNNKLLSVIIVAAIVIAGFAATLKNINEIVQIFGLTKKESNSQNLTKFAKLSPHEVEGIVLNLLKEKPQFYGYQNINGQNFILTFTRFNKTFTLFKEFTGFWENVQTIDTLYQDYAHESFDEWEFVEIDSLPSLYYTMRSSGNAFGSIDYNIIAFNKDYSFKLYSIFVSGAWANEGQFDVSDLSIERNALAKQESSFSLFIEKKIKESNAILALTDEDLDINNPKNASKNWAIENAQLVKSLSIEDDSTKFENYDFSVKFKYFNSDLTQYMNSSLLDKQEGDDFILYDYFKACCIIQDKKSKNYFIAFVHDGVFLNGIVLKNDILVIQDEIYFGKPFTINLRNGSLKFY